MCAGAQGGRDGLLRQAHPHVAPPRACAPAPAALELAGPGSGPVGPPVKTTLGNRPVRDRPPPSKTTSPTPAIGTVLGRAALAPALLQGVPGWGAPGPAGRTGVTQGTAVGIGDGGATERPRPRVGHGHASEPRRRGGSVPGAAVAPGFGSDPSHSSLRRPASVSDARAPSQLPANLKLRVRPRPETVRWGPGRSAGMVLFPGVVRRGHRFLSCQARTRIGGSCH